MMAATCGSTSTARRMHPKNRPEVLRRTRLSGSARYLIHDSTTAEWTRCASGIRREARSKSGTTCVSPLQGDEPGLVAYYRMDQQDGTTLYNISPFDHDGTLEPEVGPPNWVASSAFNTWIGSDSTAWATATNWSRGSVPATSSPYDNVVLPDYSNSTGYPAKNDPTISGDPTVNHLVLAADAGSTPLLRPDHERQPVFEQ